MVSLIIYIYVTHRTDGPSVHSFASVGDGVCAIAYLPRTVIVAVIVALFTSQ